MPWIRLYDPSEGGYGHRCLCDEHADDVLSNGEGWELDWYQEPNAQGYAYPCDIEGCLGLATDGINPHTHEREMA